MISPARLRKWLTRKGPLFIKLGQLLALRPDILPQEYCDELIKLLDQVNFFPWHEAKDILSQELDCDPDEIFSYIQSRPIGAGSIAQVHLARLHSGEEVTIKIQRPDIESHVAKNLKHVRLLLKLLSMGPLKLAISSNELIDEISAWLKQELDFGIELNNLTRLYSLGKDSQLQTFPKPYPQWSRRRVLVAEHLEGVPISEVIRLVIANKHKTLTRLGINPDAVANNLLVSCLTQIFDYRFFHMDLHPGNLIVLPNNTLGFVDFGLCGQLDSTVNARQIRYFSAMFSGNSENMFHAAMDVLESDEHSDPEAFKRDFYMQTSVWQAKQATNVASDKPQAFAKAQPFTKSNTKAENKRSQTAEWLVQIMRSARNTKMRIPVGVLAMYRSLLTAESVANLISAKHSLPSIGKAFFIKHQTKEIGRSLTPENLQNHLLNVASLLQDSPAKLERILTDLAERRLTINANVNDTNKNRKTANKRFRLIALCLIAISLTILLTIETLPVILGVPLKKFIAGCLAVAYVWIFILWRRLG